MLEVWESELMWIQLSAAISLGMICALLPGPVIAALFSESTRSGWTGARRIVLAAGLGEIIMAIISVGILAWGTKNTGEAILPWLGGMSCLGALVLFWIALGLWKNLGELAQISDSQIFLVTFLNGMAWVFWFTVCAPQALALGREIPWGEAWFILGFDLGWLLATLGICWLFVKAQVLFSTALKRRRLYQFLALLFCGFAFRLGYQGILGIIGK